MKFRHLEYNDYYKGYYDLLGGMTFICKKPDFVGFVNIVNKLNQNCIIIVCEYNNKIIATGTLFMKPNLFKNENVGNIEDIYVYFQYRNLNIGERIVQILLSYAKKMNCYKIILNCNKDCVLFFEKCGFLKIKHKEQMAKYYLSKL
jgi:glucosamine-phosphate N-acetyltransferase